MQSTMSQGRGELAPPQGLIQDPQRSAHLVRENRCFVGATMWPEMLRRVHTTISSDKAAQWTRDLSGKTPRTFKPAP